MMRVFLICLLFTVVLGRELTYKTFTARGITLKSGQVIQTSTDWGPLPWPEGPVAIRHFSSDIVDVDGKSVPLEELYVHHWLMYDGNNNQNGGFCMALSNIFGCGAEIRGVQIVTQYPFAILCDGTERWTVNLHFIRTSNVPEEDIQDCIECRCRDSRPPKFPQGGVECCLDQTMCWGMRNSTLDDPKQYFFQYTVGWEPIDDGHKASKVYSTDITAHFNTDCIVEYNVPEVKPGEYNIKKTTYNIPSNFLVAYVETHQHVGGLDMTLEHYRNGENLGVMCYSAPVYSSTHGYIEDVPPCHYPEAYVLLQGDQLRITSRYTGRTLIGGNAWHSGVMSLAFLIAHADPFPKELCLARLHELCGPSPYPTLAQCVNCSTRHLAELMKHNCTIFMINNDCDKNLGGGNVPVPDSVNSMTLKSRSIAADYYEINVTSPADRWFGIGLKPLVGTMNGAIAWVYTKNETTGETTLQRRVLGNHSPGKLVNNNITITHFKVVANVMHITFESAVGLTTDLVDNNSPIPGFCWLFAQGDKGVYKMGYHGSFRGATCL